MWVARNNVSEIVGVLSSKPSNTTRQADGEAPTGQRLALLRLRSDEACLRCHWCAVFTVITQAVYDTLQAWTASGPSQEDSGTTLYLLEVSSIA